MVGDTDPPKCSVYRGFSLENSRTCRNENKREFTAAPVPGAPCFSKTKIPAAAGTVAGTNYEISTPLPYRTAPGFARYTVSPSLLVEVLA